MHKKYRQWFMGGLLVLAAACQSGGTYPPVSALKEGLNVFQSIPEWGLNAAYLKNGQVIYIETRIGAQIPDELRFVASTITHEMDVRYLDANGNFFSGQRGGDTWIDSTW